MAVIRSRTLRRRSGCRCWRGSWRGCWTLSFVFKVIEESLRGCEAQGGHCKPCAFMHQGRCANEIFCLFCDLCSSGENKNFHFHRDALSQSSPYCCPYPFEAGVNELRRRAVAVVIAAAIVVFIVVVVLVVVGFLAALFLADLFSPVMGNDL